MKPYDGNDRGRARRDPWVATIRFAAGGFAFRLGEVIADDAEPVANKCKRDNIVGASETDWMEWQAGYVCGAILIPA